MSEDVVYSEVVFVKKKQADKDDEDDPDQCDLQKRRSCCDGVRLVLTALCVIFTTGLIALSFLCYMQATSNHNFQKKLQDLQEVHDALQENFTAFSAVLEHIYNREQNLSRALNNSAQCPEDWQYHAGKCYYFSSNTNTLDWFKSRDACISDGGHLVIINNRDEQEFLMSKTNKYKGSFWIGLTDKSTEGQWLWVDNTKLSTDIRYWNGQEPDNWKGYRNEYTEGEDCARIEQNNWNINSWFDAFCTIAFRRICETRSSR
ncbi:immune-related, lectin-like receptor 4 [Danio rerio]|uniref:Immune-related lectin-like receptor-like n=1 Tax=Danio rerio TaxID=7955 RepID=Q24K30_DANRE|nr:immune-related, lectin-like receptor 4 [Danio rerio]AAY43092.1 immune-related lectin-like receptor-like [Danio rerio]|eukprot:NP_001035129.1 immune-related, lectin-like receptor 4 [Danio rerio]